MAAAEIPCPFCGEMIKSTAKKCRFCGEFLEAGLTRQAVLEEHAAVKDATAAVQEVAAAVEAPSKEETPPAAPEADSAPKAEASAEAPAEAAAPPAGLAEVYKKVNALPDSESKTKLLANLKALEEKTDDADETEVEGIIQNVTEFAPDVAEVAINTLINPASGVTTLVQKIAMRFAGGKKQG